VEKPPEPEPPGDEEQNEQDEQDDQEEEEEQQQQLEEEKEEEKKPRKRSPTAADVAAAMREKLSPEPRPAASAVRSHLIYPLDRCFPRLFADSACTFHVDDLVRKRGRRAL